MSQYDAFLGQLQGLAGSTEEQVPESATPKLRYRSVFISDLHLGMRDCKAKFALEFLEQVECENLYLVGDILDFWKMKRAIHWPEINSRVLNHFLRLAANGTKVVYVPGNHDELMRDHIGLKVGDIEVQREAVHVGADGTRWLVFHGDELDNVVKHNKWLAHVGSFAYDAALLMNRFVNFTRRKLGFQYWSLSSYLKQTVKNAVSYISNFEQAVCHLAHRHQVDGVVCGHIHKAALDHINGLRYANCGDWVESCTALVEKHDGTFDLVFWTDLRQDYIRIADVDPYETGHCDGRLATAN